MLLCLRRNLREEEGEGRRPEWRGGLISWQKPLHIALGVVVGVMFCSSPPLTVRVRDSKGSREKRKGRRRMCAVLAYPPPPVLSSWQTSYLTQLITHLITAIA